MKVRFLCSQVIMLSVLLLSFSGCDEDDDHHHHHTSGEGFSGDYEVIITEAGFVEVHVWRLSQTGDHINIRDLNTDEELGGLVSGNNIVVSPQTVEIPGEDPVISMNLTFSSDGFTFAGSRTTKIHGDTFIAAVSGTLI